jgi:hypothetical protein
VVPASFPCNAEHDAFSAGWITAGSPPVGARTRRRRTAPGMRRAVRALRNEAARERTADPPAAAPAGRRGHPGLTLA